MCNRNSLQEQHLLLLQHHSAYSALQPVKHHKRLGVFLSKLCYRLIKGMKATTVYKRFSPLVLISEDDICMIQVHSV